MGWGGSHRVEEAVCLAIANCAVWGGRCIGYYILLDAAGVCASILAPIFILFQSVGHVGWWHCDHDQLTDLYSLAQL